MNLKTLAKILEPKTFTASLLPVFYGSVYAWTAFGRFDGIRFLLLAAGMVLVQGATNMINDYCDYARDTDQLEKADEKALVNGEITLSQLKGMIAGFILTGLAIGFYLAFIVSLWILPVIAVGILVLFAYSAGPKPICHTPYGELAAGITMGLGITATVIYIQSGQMNLLTVGVCLPSVFFISDLLLANNLSDWKEDQEAGRRTSVFYLGTAGGSTLWFGLAVLTVLWTVLMAAVHAYSIWIPILVILIFPYQNVWRAYRMPKERAAKRTLMGTTIGFGVRYHMTVIAALLIFDGFFKQLNG